MTCAIKSARRKERGLCSGRADAATPFILPRLALKVAWPLTPQMNGVPGPGALSVLPPKSALYLARRGITRGYYTPFLLILQGVALQSQGVNLPPF